LYEFANANEQCVCRVVAAANGNVDYARSASGGLLACLGGRWRPIAYVGRTGEACFPNGAFATEDNSGTGLICRLGVWVRADDLLSSYVLVSALIVEHWTSVPKPNCGQLGTSFGSPAIYVIPQIESSTGSTFTRRADDIGGAWRVQLLDADGGALKGPAKAIAHIYCKY
jgi:hypothetical protein